MIKLEKRSLRFQDGHRVAAKEAITWLHAHAATMKDQRARDAINAAADELGRRLKRAALEPWTDPTGL